MQKTNGPPQLVLVAASKPSRNACGDERAGLTHHLRRWRSDPIERDGALVERGVHKRLLVLPGRRQSRLRREAEAGEIGGWRRGSRSSARRIVRRGASVGLGDDLGAPSRLPIPTGGRSTRAAYSRNRLSPSTISTLIRSVICRPFSAPAHSMSMMVSESAASSDRRSRIGATTAGRMPVRRRFSTLSSRPPGR